MKKTNRINRAAAFLVLSLLTSSAFAQDASFVRSELERSGAVPAASKAGLQKFYGDRSFEPVFVRNGQATNLVYELKQAIQQIAPLHGLPATDYWTPSLEAISQLYPLPAYAEVQFAKAYVDLATHIAVGRLNPSSISKDIKYTRRAFTDYAVLQQAVTYGGLANALHSVAPKHQRYTSLVSGLQRMRQIELQGGFKALSAPKSTLRVGAKSPIVLEVKRRAQAMGYYVGSMDNVLDSQLSSVISDIQSSNLGAATGILSPSDSSLWEWFSVSSTRRIQQMELNLEKLRWLPSQLEERHIFVNLGTQVLNVVDPYNTNDLLKNMRVINGRFARKTPSMRDTFKNIVFNGNWTVPPTIFAEDKLTALQKILQTEGTYGVYNWFQKGRYTVVDSELRNTIDPTSIDWMNINPKTADFYIRQLPGYDNALGVVKLMMNNPWSIYLHDTNERDLFSNAMRARSSGCVRLQYPLDLVEYVLRGTTYDRYKIDSMVPHTSYDVSPKETWLKIPAANNIPIYTLSVTTNVGSDGIIRFTQDLYKQNLAILNALNAAGFAK